MRGKLEQREEGKVGDSPADIWEDKVPVRGTEYDGGGARWGAGKESVPKVLSWSFGAAENQTVGWR